MTNTSTPYSIDVGERRANGFRDVILKNRGRRAFTVTHREVQYAFLGFFYAPGSSSAAHLSGEDGHTSGSDTRVRPPQEFLCVFHREELKDRLDRYVVSQPTTFCSAYTVRDGAQTVFALQGISPIRITPGRTGVFIYGQRQNTRWAPHTPLTLDIRGLTYTAAADIWWMASPLVVKPVYILDQPPSGKAGGTRASCSSQGDGSPDTRPLSSQQQQPHWHLRGGFVPLNAEILSQFSPTGEPDDDALIAIVRTGAEELSLARTTPAHHLDVMTFAWLPHRVCIPALSSNSAALTFTVSEHRLFAREQILFLYDSPQRTVHIVKLSHLSAESGEHDNEEDGGGGDGGHANLLFTLRQADFPLVLPCLRHSVPQPVLVCNYPMANVVSLFSPLLLLRQGHERDVRRCIVAQWTLPHPAVGNATQLAVPHSSARRDGESEYRQSPADAPRVVGMEYQDYATVAFLCDGREEKDEESVAGADGPRGVCVSFASLQVHENVLLRITLESLAAVLGEEAECEFEQVLLRHLWDAPTGSAVDAAAVCFGLIRAQVAHAVGGPTKAPIDEGNTTLERLLSSMIDPLSLTAAGVEALGKGTVAADDTAPAPLMWTPQMAALSTVALHLLCESCRLVKKLCGFVDEIAALVLSLAAMLGWVAYEAYYRHPCTATREHRHGHSFTELLPPAVLRRTFTCVTSEQAPPSFRVGRAEDALLHAMLQARQVNATPTRKKDAHLNPGLRHEEDRGGDGDSDGVALTSFERGEPVDVYAVLMGFMAHGAGTTSLGEAGHVWPRLNGLPKDHPIAAAGDLCQLFYETIYEAAATATTGTAAADSEGGMTADAASLGALRSLPWWYRVCQALSTFPRTSCITSRLIKSDLAIGAAFPLLCAIAAGRDNFDAIPHTNDALAAVVGRLDRINDATVLRTLSEAGSDVVRLAEERAITRRLHISLTDDDGVMMRLDFPQMWRDSRLDAAQVYFNTSRPIHIPPRTGGEQPADVLRGLALRVCALPIGRGMLTMSTHNFRVRDSIPIPRLNLDGRTSDGVFVSNTAKEMQSEQLLWPLFHNGCAAGLRFLPLGSNAAAAAASGSSLVDTAPTAMDGSAKESVITRQWVVYQTKNVHSPSSRAGLLLAAGILGHLKVLQLTDIYSLLVSPRVHYTGREATTMAVMLGLSCSFRGTNNDLVFRCLSMHVQSLTPRAEEIDVSLDVQTCALVSIGMLCQRSPTNVFLADMYLVEMSRLPSDEHCMHREGYALGAGFGLGLLLLGLGGSHGIPHVETQLFSFLEGGRRDSAPFARHGGGIDTYEERNCDEAGNFLTRALLQQGHKAASRALCTRVFEGDYYNTAISGPAAAVALGLMFLKTENTAVAQKLYPPDRLTALQGVSPVLCLLRTCFAALTCWSAIRATEEYIHSVSVPSVLRTLTPQSGGTTVDLAPQQVHYLMMNHGHCIAGAVLALGLRFAGSMNPDVRDLVLRELDGFLKGRLGATAIAVPTLQRSTGAYDMCVSACCIAVGLVMAGTGDLTAFAALQRMHSRPNTAYGTHMALSMSAGLLFLGGGRLSLSTRAESIAALVLAFYPVWPKDPEGNTHHLQILRHLYGLAVVPRLVEAVDIVTGRPVSVPLTLVLREEEPPSLDGTPGEHKRRVVRVETPCLYPPPKTVERIEVRSRRHYPHTIRNGALVGGSQGSCIGERGLLLRVLENHTMREAEEEGGCGGGEHNVCRLTMTGERWGDPALCRNAAERRLLDDVRVLFSRRNHSMARSVLLLDSVKLLVASQKRLLGHGFVTRLEDTFAGSVADAISPDVARAVTHTLERRYRAIFTHGPNGTRRGHPFSRVLLRGESWSAVVDSIVANPAGTEAFPLDFRVMCPHSDATAAALGIGATDLANRAEIERWLAESLHFYFCNSTAFARLAAAMKSAEPQLADITTRTLTLLKVNRELQLPIDLLQRVVACCFDD